MGKRMTKADLQKALDKEIELAKSNYRLIEQAAAEREELLELRAEVRHLALNLSKGHAGLPQETLVRMFQAEDELKRMRHILADVGLERAGDQPLVSAFAQGLLSGHLRAPALRITDPNNPL